MRERRNNLAYLLLSAALSSLPSAVPLTLADEPTEPRPAGKAAGPVPAALPQAAPAADAAADNEILRLARSDPAALFALAQERCERNVRDYACVLHKQERLGGVLTKVQELEVRFRQQPLSVYMIWRANAEKARRALFIDAPQFVNADGAKFARIEPAGFLARAFVSQVERPIHGDEARNSSRRTIDEFGFRFCLTSFNRVTDMARRNDEVSLRYQGEGRVDGRPTLVFVRELPYSGPGGLYPDARMIIQLDREWLVPTALHSYADAACKELLGSYVFSQVRLNPGLTDRDFDF